MATPTVDSINVTSAQSGDRIEIHGSGFSQRSEDIYVQFGDAECPVTSSREEEIQCTLSESFAGSKPLYLHVSSRGVANTSRIVLDYSLELESISPIEGSTAGGTEVTINGCGFYDSETDDAINVDTVFQQQFAVFRDDTLTAKDCLSGWQNIVTLGGNVCEVVESTLTTLTILTPAEMTNESAYDVTVEVHCPDRPQDSRSQTLVGSYVYNTALTPTLTSIHPTEGTIHGGDTITLSGSGFSSVTEENTVKVISRILAPLAKVAQYLQYIGWWFFVHLDFIK